MALAVGLFALAVFIACVAFQRVPHVQDSMAQLFQVGSNHLEDVAFAAQEGFVTQDLLPQVVVLLEDFVSFQGSQLAELHADHRLGLRLGHAVLRLVPDLAH